MADWTTPQQREALRAQGWTLVVSEEYEQWQYGNEDLETHLQVEEGPTVTWVQGYEVQAVLSACAVLSGAKNIVYEGTVYDLYKGWVYDPLSESERISIIGASPEDALEGRLYIENDLSEFEGKRVRVTMTIEVLE